MADGGETTAIRGLAWVIAFDATTGRHRYERDADVVFTDDRLVHIGARYEGHVDREVDGSGQMAVPGLVNVHCHPAGAPLSKGYREEFGNPQMYMSPLYDRGHLLQADDEGMVAAARYTMCELLTSGVTSVVDVTESSADARLRAAGTATGWLDTLASSGIRAWIAPSFASARWSTDNGHSVRYLWDEPAGRRGLEEAVGVAEAADAHPSGRLAGMLAPAQVDTCTEELLTAARDAARERGWRVQVHASQSLVEFQEMTRRHGVTPVQWLDRIGMLGEDLSLAHVLFVDSHSWTRWPTRVDVSLLAETRTAVAHCPGVFSRNGQTMEDVGGYIRAGVTLGIGTDSFPQNMLEEMRVAAVLGRVTTGVVQSVTTEEILHAATIGGATVVGRDDIGRLAPGAKADLVLVDLEAPVMKPIRDPLRSLIYTAADRAVRDVYVDGVRVVGDGEVLTIDWADAADGVQRAQERAERDSPSRHYAGKSALEVAPLSLPTPD